MKRWLKIILIIVIIYLLSAIATYIFYASVKDPCKFLGRCEKAMQEWLARNQQDIHPYCSCGKYVNGQPVSIDCLEYQENNGQNNPDYYISCSEDYPPEQWGLSKRIVFFFFSPAYIAWQVIDGLKNSVWKLIFPLLL